MDFESASVGEPDDSDGTTGIKTGIKDMLGIFEGLVDREAVAEELPDLFAGVQSGAAGWQRQQGEVVLNN